MSETRGTITSPKLFWDWGTAYDFFVSLSVLHNPQTFGLRAAWAAGMRSRLPSGERESLEQFQRIPLFSGLTNSEIRKLMDFAEDRAVLHGETVVREGEASDAFYIIGEGCFEVVKSGLRDQSIVIARLHELSFFGEMAIVSKEPRAASVECVEAGWLKRFSGEAFEELLRDDDDTEVRQTAVFWLAQVGERQDEAAAILSDLALHESDERVRSVALHALGQVDSPEARDVLRQIVLDSTLPIEVRAQAMMGIGLGHPEAFDILREVIASDPDEEVRAAAAKALKAIGARAGADCVRHLMPLTRSGQSALRVIGLRALAAAGGPAALAAVSPARPPPTTRTVRSTSSSWGSGSLTLERRARPMRR